MSAWDDEYAPASLVALGAAARTGLGLGVTAIGMKGDRFHPFGYHRSRRWILTDPGSEYGSDDYSVTDALDQGGDQNWVCALDITPSSVEQMIAICKRVDSAMRADRLPAVREFYGNVDGDQIVDGWDDLTHRAATSDDSHLWHLHLSFYRSRAGDDHAAVLAVLLGQPLEEDDMSELASEIIEGMALGNTKTASGNQIAPTIWRQRDELWQASVTAALARDEARDAATATAITALTAAIKAGGGSVDSVAITTAIRESAQQVGDRIHAELLAQAAREAKAAQAEVDVLKG